MSMKVTFTGKEGMFHVEKYAFFHQEHETVKGMNEHYKGLRKELVKMSKNDDVMIDICNTGITPWYYPVRLIIRKWDCQVEYRPYNRSKSDFSDVTMYKFTSEKAQMDYVVKTIKDFGLEILGELPEETSLYRQELQRQ